MRNPRMRIRHLIGLTLTLLGLTSWIGVPIYSSSWATRSTFTGEAISSTLAGWRELEALIRLPTSNFISPESDQQVRVSFNIMPLTFIGNLGQIVQDAKCNATCFRSPQFFLLHPNKLPGGTVLIGGVNSNTPVSTRNVTAIRFALKGGQTLLEQLNQGFVTAQLNIGGIGAPVTTNVLWSKLSCFGFNFRPITLSNGVILTPDSMLKDLFMQAQIAVRNLRTPALDMFLLSSLFDRLNGNDPLGRCQPPNNFLFAGVCVSCVEGIACAGDGGNGFAVCAGGGVVSTFRGSGSSEVNCGGCRLGAFTTPQGLGAVFNQGCAGCFTFRF